MHNLNDEKVMFMNKSKDEVERATYELGCVIEKNPSTKEASCSEVWTVSQLNSAVSKLLSDEISHVWVIGELSNVTLASSGHWYFVLKDATAQVRAVMFRKSAEKLTFKPKEGVRVQVYARTGLYESRGDFQLTVSVMQPAGAGDLYQRFLALKDSLGKKGLFDAERKRSFPSPVRVVGVVTSARAAALRDVLTTLRKRAPRLKVILYPCLVQGSEAPNEIVEALSVANKRKECDVLLLVRGGGSIEDLWAFNESVVAYAIAESLIPIVSGVGHETDFTIADFVADFRAATPTAAAVLVSPDCKEQMTSLMHLYPRLARYWRRYVEHMEQKIDFTARLLRSPKILWRQRVDSVQAFAIQLQRLMRLSLMQLNNSVNQMNLAMELMDPEAVLGRGYALVRDVRGRILLDSTSVSVGDSLCVSLARGSLFADVQSICGG